MAAIEAFELADTRLQRIDSLEPALLASYQRAQQQLPGATEEFAHLAADADRLNAAAGELVARRRSMPLPEPVRDKLVDWADYGLTALELLRDPTVPERLRGLLRDTRERLVQWFGIDPESLSAARQLEQLAPNVELPVWVTDPDEMSPRLWAMEKARPAERYQQLLSLLDYHDTLLRREFELQRLGHEFDTDLAETVTRANLDADENDNGLSDMARARDRWPQNCAPGVIRVVGDFVRRVTGREPAGVTDNALVRARGLDRGRFATELGAHWRRDAVVLGSLEQTVAHVHRHGGAVAGVMRFGSSGDHAFAVTTDESGHAVVFEMVDDVEYVWVDEDEIREWLDGCADRGVTTVLGIVFDSAGKLVRPGEGVGENLIAADDTDEGFVTGSAGPH